MAVNSLSFNTLRYEGRC